ncbi:hypothetical protein ACHHYP_00119 [Achlya hypogyna]|uniref:E2F/DP family winged-helix DNA-binding domain-containing protein n=1 Tax=Achlya hypogyna TaxID=1202772 RepID=A0A1V9ZBL5_ACHHY|nr:hypothetical protein ACHHYP_00119 [Achlya hypogyna]
MLHAPTPSPVRSPMRTKERSARNTNLQRMDKSITVLSVKFCAMLREATGAVNIVQAAKALGTQKRRLHEILNIIQSVGLIAKVGIGLCRWLGEASMLSTLQALKRVSPVAAPDSKQLHKKAVATALSERFVQVFLHQVRCEPVVLEDIMHVITTDLSPCRDEPSVSPTRRIYDIANVLSSLQLIKKILVVKPETKRKQITFVWCGPSPVLAPPKFPRIQPTPPLEPSAKRARSGSEATSAADISPPFTPPAHLPPQSGPARLLELSPLYLILRNEQLTKELAASKAREADLAARLARLEEAGGKLRRPALFRPLPFLGELDARVVSPSQTSMMAASTLLSFTPNRTRGDDDAKENRRSDTGGRGNGDFDGLSPLVAARMPDDCALY